MNKIKWIEQDGERIALKKSLGAWRVVYPFKNEDGTMNWKNTLFPGGLDGVIKWIMIMALLLLFYSVYAHDTQVCRDTMANLSSTCALINGLNLSNTPTTLLPGEFNLSLGDIYGDSVRTLP